MGIMDDSVETRTPPNPGGKRKKEPEMYPAPFIVPPTTAHTQTILFLHGRGSNGEKFGQELLASKTATGQTIQERFPGMKFIFPTAKKRRAKWYKRALISQWFDNVPIDEQSKEMSREEIEWQVEGLTETAEFLNPLLDEEVRAVGAKNVFLGGLSQGCAMALHLLLSYQPREEGRNGDWGSLGGFVGMSGWLPFAEDIRGLIRSEDMIEKAGEDEEDDDPFATSDDEGDSAVFESHRCQLSLSMQVCNFVRENIEMSPLESIEPLCLKTPVFLGHGKKDEKVKIALGLDIVMILRVIGMQVRWEEYDEGHWYKVPEQIDDLVDFLETCAGSAI
ncbi:alpha/beta-hydrolase [Mollisia scopiformis]|uniref:Alpha/beta-hydrolase n=1 Tax=Mollisia scopiformis TaxID=149040 RepID=A0A194XTW7_MOLSC|nr:alpha/beta-hydrolase [Mollisia scopiformis]KUJ23479.1 alpha/beta-hydrolase [Mollisia scopiformis]